MSENDKYRLKVGDRIQLGDGAEYEILNFYFTTEEVASWNVVIELKNLDNGRIEKNLVEEVLELLRNGNLYKPSSELSKWYYDNVVKSR